MNKEFEEFKKNEAVYRAEELLTNYNNIFEKIEVEKFSSIRTKEKLFRYKVKDVMTNELKTEFCSEKELCLSDYRKTFKFSTGSERFSNTREEIIKIFKFVSKFNKIFFIYRNETMNVRDILLSESGKEIYFICKNKEQNKIINFSNIEKGTFIVR